MRGSRSRERSELMIEYGLGVSTEETIKLQSWMSSRRRTGALQTRK